ncbi:family 20 glycosylhydrolase [Caulobacter sp. 17J65-9]|uniref:family 20 glycosylhydrolase n=1 Tax=Caulobacter sp. 17J65-9 TaxID=2709382 RepID=UPI0013C70100|nr:family 20 glycosylhydrolase [Caulobacter sp. 17J65-9]NEX94012.1 family 20 glycosylhydrolase [Caulobacter sp. 17J65-9]
MRQTSSSSARAVAALASVVALLAGCAHAPLAQTAPAPAGAEAAASPSALLPAPMSVTPAAGAFTVRDGTVLVVPTGDAGARASADYLKDLLARTRGLDLTVREGRAPAGAIVLRRSAQGAREGYDLAISPKGVEISAADDAGLFYGAVSLWELLTQTEGRADAVTLQAASIHDAPRFAWRGLMLDSARHYQSPEFVKRFIDVMALHKLNTLHWHLVDDQAWRLEIKKYPKLTEVAAWRVPAGQGPANDIDPATGRPRLYGGFYTQDQVREIVAYAAARHVTIVPEIEMPGHATAPITAYPALGVDGEAPTTGMSDWGVYPNLYNVDDGTFAFLEDVLSEVIELFPGEYVHVGGDEAVKDQWKASPRIQAQMKALGISDEHALQSWFVQRVGKYLDAHGKRLIGWDEILEGGIAPNATIMSWRGVDGAITAAKAGHDAVLAPAPTLYFDNRQSDSGDEPPGRGNLIDLKTVYDFDPAPAALTPDQQGHILGLQANLWTEHIRSEDRAAYMFFPRAAAVAELGWSGADKRDWNGFLDRLVPQMGRYEALGINASDAAWEVRFTDAFDRTAGRASVTLANQVGRGQIRYTLDGSEPTEASALYAGPLDLALGARVRAATFEGGRQLSKPVEKTFDALSVRRRQDDELKTCSAKLVLSLDDDGPMTGPREPLVIDIIEPCWKWEGADLSDIKAISAAVSSLPFNFQIGKDRDAIKFRPPATPEGELEVRLDSCEGERIAVLPLKPAVASAGVTELPPAPITPRAGRHDLCITYTAKSVDPLWAIDWIQLVPATR